MKQVFLQSIGFRLGFPIFLVLMRCFGCSLFEIPVANRHYSFHDYVFWLDCFAIYEMSLFRDIHFIIGALKSVRLYFVRRTTFSDWLYM